MILTDNWRIYKDSSAGYVLEFFEDRTVEKEGSKNEGKTYEYSDKYYYPNLKTALKAFLNKYIGDAKDIEDVLKRIEDVEQLIESKW